MRSLISEVRYYSSLAIALSNPDGIRRMSNALRGAAWISVLAISVYALHAIGAQ